MASPEDSAPLPDLPADGEMSWYPKRDAFDDEVRRRLQGYLSPNGLKQELEAPISSLRVADLLNSWWAYPDCVIDPVKRRVFITGSTRGGAVKVAWFDLLSHTVGEQILSQERHLSDDHYTRSLMLRSLKPPISFGGYHDRDQYMRVVRGKSYQEFEMLEAEQILTFPGIAAAAYGQFVGPRPTVNTDMLGAFFRGDGVTMFARSADYGLTWTLAGRLHSRAYGLHRRSGNTGHFTTVTHPTDVTPELKYFKVGLTDGIPRNAAGGGIRNTPYATATLWDWQGDVATPFVDYNSADLVRRAPTGESQRTFDMTTNGRRMLVGTYADKNNLDVGCTYKVMVRQTSDATNAWSEETLIFSGKAYGPSGYVGGACFAADGSVLLIRESAGKWTLERWVRTGADFAPGTWALDRVLYTAPAGIVAMGRPRVPINCDDFTLTPGVVTWGEYHRYDQASFLDFYGDQRVLEWA